MKNINLSKGFLFVFIFAFLFIIINCSKSNSRSQESLGCWQELGMNGEVIAHGERFADKKLSKLFNQYKISDTINIWTEGGGAYQWITIKIENTNFNCEKMHGGDLPSNVSKYIKNEYKVFEVHFDSCDFFLTL